MTTNDNQFHFQGRAWVFGDNIDTDRIAPGKYMGQLDPQEHAAHVMEGVDAEFPKKVRPGDIIVAGSNFGCGSSRERAPSGIKTAGVRLLIAHSFARIFLRNAINIGLAVLESPDLRGQVLEGDLLDVDLATGVITNLRSNQKFHAKPFPPFLQELVSAGGLVPYARMRLAKKELGNGA